MNIDVGTSFKMFSRDIEKKMKLERLEAIKAQFVDFGVQYMSLIHISMCIRDRMDFYSLDVIISVGYCVKFLRGT